jgi:hypothetical protein
VQPRGLGHPCAARSRTRLALGCAGEAPARFRAWARARRTRATRQSPLQGSRAREARGRESAGCAREAPDHFRERPRRASVNDALEAAGVEVVETDLGEYILQLAREPPSHIVAPVVHKTREEVSLLFERKHGAARKNAIAELTREARERLRPVYQAVGGYAYGGVYPGPMGSVLTPAYAGLERAADLPNASTFGNQCGVVCPVKIPLPGLMRKLREQQFASRLKPWTERAALALSGLDGAPPHVLCSGCMAGRAGARAHGRTQRAHPSSARRDGLDPGARFPRPRRAARSVSSTGSGSVRKAAPAARRAERDRTRAASPLRTSPLTFEAIQP